LKSEKVALQAEIEGLKKEINELNQRISALTLKKKILQKRRHIWMLLILRSQMNGYILQVFQAA